MSTLTNEPVTIDVDNTEDWLIQINDTDLSGQPISHTGETLLAEIKGADGAIVFSAESGDELTLVGGTTHSILLTVPWGIVKDLPAAQYFASLVVVVSPTSRRKIIDLVIRHDVK